MKKVKTHVFLGKRYKIRFVNSKQLDGNQDESSDLCTLGECDDPRTPCKEIKIDKDLKDLEMLDTICHECGLHANFPFLKEEVVEQAASDLARLLWRLGYRKIDNGN